LLLLLVVVVTAVPLLMLPVDFVFLIPFSKLFAAALSLAYT